MDLAHLRTHGHSVQAGELIGQHTALHAAVQHLYLGGVAYCSVNTSTIRERRGESSRNSQAG